MSVDVKIKGLDQLANGLKSLPNKLARRVLNKAMKKGAQLLADVTKEKTPVDTGALRDSIAVKLKKVSNVETQAIMGSHEKEKDGVYYAHMVEYGGKYVIKARGLDKGKKKGRVIAAGSIKAQPFMRPAFDSSKDQVIDAISKEIEAGVAVELSKIAKTSNG